MFKESKQMRNEIVKNSRGGKGDVQVIHLFEQNELKSKSIKLCASIVINPGVTVGLHSHDEDEELYIFLKGKGTFLENGEKKVMLPGMVSSTGYGESHGIENHTDEPLEYIAIVIQDQNK